MNSTKLPSLILALALQLLPITRVFVATTPATGTSFAIVSTWIAGIAALLGSYNAVSGASTTISSPTNAVGTNGTPFSYRITAGPQAAHWFSAAPLPTGLACDSATGRITGTPTQSGLFTVLMTATDGSNDPERKTTRNLYLTILAGGGTTNPPSIITQPGSRAATNGGVATLTVVAGGSAPLVYQWQTNDVAITGATNATLTLSPVTTNHAGNYTVVITNLNGSITSAVATLTVLVRPSITTQPVSQTATAGDSPSFTAAAAGTAPLSYQWRRGTTNVAGATGATLSFPSVTMAQAGNYSVVVANSAGSVTSGVATLIVITPPGITTQPASRTATNGGIATFSVVATGTAPLGYQWRTNDIELAGATNSTLTLSSVTTNHAGNYSVVMTNSAGSITSSVAVLTVLVRPSITTQPASQTVTVGDNASFTVAANGTAPLSYQWRRSGTNLIGSTSMNLSLTSVTTGQAGNYSVAIANSAGSITSAVATLTVNAAPTPPSITTQPASRTVTNGGATTFTVVATGNSPLTYQWLTNGVELTDATNSTLNLASVTSDHAGEYSVVIANSMGSATSAVAVLTVLVRPSIASQPANLTLAASDNASFTVTADGTAPLRYQWRRNGANVTGATNMTLNLPGVTTLQAGNYTVVVANNAGSVTSSVATLTVYIVTLPFSLSKVGNGTLTGPTNGQLIELGKAYVLKATPAAGNMFSNWIVSGQAVTGATLNVTMSSNLTVVANFVPNPFLGLKGTYSGLFHPATANPPHERSGYFTLAVTDKGAYTGKLLINGGTFSMKGAFGLDLSAQKTVLRRGTNELFVSLQLSAGLDQVTGSVSNALWMSELFGYRSAFHSTTNPATNLLGKYTMLLSGSDDAVASPLGLGCATIAVASSGGVTIKGTLGDGTATAQKGALAANGQLPVYVKLYSGKGSMFGWLTFTNTATNDIPGLLLWTRKDGILGNYYPGGFTNEVVALASRYTPPLTGSAVLGFSNSVVLLEGGNLSGPATNDVFLSSLNKIAVTSTNTNKLALVVTASSGMLSGSHVNPQNLKKSTIKGVVLQKQDLGGGFFLGTNQSGCVFFGLPQDAPVFAP